MTALPETRWIAKLVAVNAVWLFIIMPIVAVFVVTANVVFVEHGRVPPDWFTTWLALAIMAVATGPTVYLTWREFERVRSGDR